MLGNTWPGLKLLRQNEEKIGARPTKILRLFKFAILVNGSVCQVYPWLRKKEQKSNNLRFMFVTDHCASKTLIHTFFRHRAANEFHTRKNINAARQKHGKALDFHASLLACWSCCSVPLIKIPAFGLVVDVIKEAMLWYQQSITLESPSYS